MVNLKSLHQTSPNEPNIFGTPKGNKEMPDCSAGTIHEFPCNTSKEKSQKQPREINQKQTNHQVEHNDERSKEIGARKNPHLGFLEPFLEEEPPSLPPPELEEDSEGIAVIPATETQRKRV